MIAIIIIELIISYHKNQTNYYLLIINIYTNTFCKTGIVIFMFEWTLTHLLFLLQQNHHNYEMAQNKL